MTPRAFCLGMKLTGGGALERVQIFILVEGLKIEFFGIIS